MSLPPTHRRAPFLEQVAKTNFQKGAIHNMDKDLTTNENNQPPASGSPDDTEKNSSMDLLTKLKRWFVFVIAGIIGFLGFQHAFGGVWLSLLPWTEPTHHLVIDMTVLYYFGAAAVLIVLERVTKFSISSSGISADIAELKQDVKNVKESQKETLLVAEGGVGGKGSAVRDPVLPATPVINKALAEAPADSGSKTPFNPDDPLKGKFNGVATHNGRTLSATVFPAKSSPGYFRVNLLVQSESGATPLVGTVKFFLHPTFRPPLRTVKARDGKAKLELLSYGAFTVLAEADNEETRLELDLAEDKRFPLEFRQN